MMMTFLMSQSIRTQTGSVCPPMRNGNMPAGQEKKTYQYSDIDNIAWHKGNSQGYLHNAGEKLPNEWGLYDMLGNIWEWTWDLYNRETYPSFRIFRGGSFAEEPRICGSTTRRKSHPGFAIDDLGFRLARSL